MKGRKLFSHPYVVKGVNASGSGRIDFALPEALFLAGRSTARREEKG